MIVPGGRFREFYYWDSYWIVQGLLHCDMQATAKGMLKNFLAIVQRFGFIPNGGRIYYSMRSQPPLLPAMVKIYVDATNDTQFVEEAVHVLEDEFNFWLTYHAVSVNGHTLIRYGDRSYGPRPESYREDIQTAESFQTEEEKQAHYAELKAAAESGMDFSSRWFMNPDDDWSNKGTLKNLKTRSIVPVELNAILYWNANIIADFHRQLGNTAKVSEYEKHATNIMNVSRAGFSCPGRAGIDRLKTFESSSIKNC